MRLLLLVLAVLSFTILAEAQNFSSYVPECASPCVEQTLNSSKVCTGLDDNTCLCTNASQILFPSVRCFIQTCNSTNLGELRCMYKMDSLSLNTFKFKEYLALGFLVLSFLSFFLGSRNQ